MALQPFFLKKNGITTLKGLFFQKKKKTLKGVFFFFEQKP